jgi:hypothetical protein
MRTTAFAPIALLGRAAQADDESALRIATGESERDDRRVYEVSSLLGSPRSACNSTLAKISEQPSRARVPGSSP